MKHDKPKVTSKWSDEKVKLQIDLIDVDIANYNIELNNWNSRIAEIQQKKKSIRIRISNKTKYRNQLIKNHTDNLNELETNK